MINNHQDEEENAVPEPIKTEKLHIKKQEKKSSGKPPLQAAFEAKQKKAPVPQPPAKYETTSSMNYQPGSYMFPYHEESTRCGECQSTIQIRFRCPFIQKESES